MLCACLIIVSRRLVFTRSVVKGGINIIFDEKYQEWGLAESIRDDYVETMTRRVMNLCRVVAQALAKGTKAQWVQELPFVKVAEPSEASSSTPSSAVEVKYLYQFSDELKTRE